MPELPDVTVYIEHLARRTVGHPLEKIRLASPFLLRTADPPIAAVYGREVRGVSRLGKRIVFTFATDTKKDEPLHLVIHLMIAGRFRWKASASPVPGKVGLAAFDFGAATGKLAKGAKDKEAGTLILTEASSKKRASLHLVRGDAALAALAPDGLEVLDATIKAFAERLRSENHTLKRALTDPHLFSGIGNAYSDEILHRARLSPLKLTSRLDDEEVTRLFDATRDTLVDWTSRMRAETGDGFPERVTAFREGMAVHGRFGQPCPVCATPVQRIRYRDNETNYCARCQTEGRLLADRALSRLLNQDWPRTIEELEG